MIVRATAQLMPGARLTPARRTYTGPRRGLGLVPRGVNYRRRRGLGDDSRILANLDNDVAAYANTGLPMDSQIAAISADLHGICAAFPDFNKVSGNATCPADLDQQIAQAVAASYRPPAADAQQILTMPAVAQMPPLRVSAPVARPGSPTIVTPVANVPVVNAPAAVQSNAPAASVAPIPTSSPAPAQSNATTPAIVVPGIASVSSFLTDSAFLGIPNWALGAGAIAVGFALFGGGRR